MQSKERERQRKKQAMKIVKVKEDEVVESHFQYGFCQISLFHCLNVSRMTDVITGKQNLSIVFWASTLLHRVGAADAENLNSDLQHRRGPPK